MKNVILITLIAYIGINQLSAKPQPAECKVVAIDKTVLDAIKKMF